MLNSTSVDENEIFEEVCKQVKTDHPLTNEKEIIDFINSPKEGDAVFIANLKRGSIRNRRRII